VYTAFGPGALGVDLSFPEAAALAADTGYDGPVMVEPFSDELNAMDPEPAARRTMDSLETIWEQAGL